VALRSRSALAATLTLFLAGCPKGPERPKTDLPPLVTAPLTSITQGPRARWAVLTRPDALFGGELGPWVSAIVPKAGLDKLEVRLGFDLRKSSEALVVGYPAATFYAARLPAGASPGVALDAYALRLLAPVSKASPRPDLERRIGGLASGGKGSAAAMWSKNGDVIVGESGRLEPVVTSMALATGRLRAGLSLQAGKSFAPLAAWAAGAPLALYALCPLAEVLGTKPEEAPISTQECFGAMLTLRAGKPGTLDVALRLTGAWGKDKEAAASEVGAALDRIAASDLGKALGLRDAGKAQIESSAEAITVHLVVDGKALAGGLARLLSSELKDATGP